ncbi:hypothetical protein [Nocardioides dilutus]
MPRPLFGVRADSELAFASLLGLAPGNGTGVAGAHPMRAGVFFSLVLVLALVLVSVGALL